MTSTRRPSRRAILTLLLGTAAVLLFSIHLTSTQWSARLPLLPSSFTPPAPAAPQVLTVPDPQDIKDRKDAYKWYSDAKLRWLAACLARGDCPKNADKVAVFGTFHCHWAVYTEYNGGEGVWCLGMMRALEAQGFTVLHAGENDWEYMSHIHRQIPDLVRVIVSEEGDAARHGTTAMYLKTKERPGGIPPWKFFSVSFFPAGWRTGVGHAWVVTAEPSLAPPGVGRFWNVSLDTDGNAWVRTGQEELKIYTKPGHHQFTYLGYPVNPQVSDALVIPWDNRPPRVWLLGKYTRYFADGDGIVYELDFFKRAHAELSAEFPGFEFVSAMNDDRSQEDKKKYGPIPDVIRNLGGELPPDEFYREVGQARLMLGLGIPTLSPSPYQALARAVPFANPHRLRKGGKEDDERTWEFTQHQSLQRVPEPYVYQIQAFNYTSFVGSIRRALQTPIPQLRFERMRDDVMQRRMADFVTADWRGEAARVLEQRVKAGKTNELFEL